MKRSSRQSTTARTERSKRLKKDRDTIEKSKSATGVLNETQTKLKRAIESGFAKSVGVAPEDIPDYLILLIWKFQNAERKCADPRCKYLYKNLHTHDGADIDWVEVEKEGRKFFYHVDCDSNRVAKMNRGKKPYGAVELPGQCLILF